MADIFGNPTKPLNKKNQSEYKTDIFGNPTSISKPQKPFYTPEPTLTPLQKILKSKPIQQGKTITKTLNQNKTTAERITGIIPKPILKQINSDSAIFNLGKYNTVLKALDKVLPQGIKDEKTRYKKRFLDSATFGATAEADKALGKDVSYREGRSFKNNKLGAALDFASTTAGYLIPGLGTVKGLKIFGMSAKTIPKLVKGASKTEKLKRTVKVLGQQAKEGAITGAVIGGAEIGVREAINPDDYSAKQNFQKLGQDILLGTILDPIAYGGIKGISKLISKARKTPEVDNVLNDINTLKNLDEVKNNINDIELGLKTPQDIMSKINPDLKFPKISKKPISNIEFISKTKENEVPIINSFNKTIENIKNNKRYESEFIPIELALKLIEFDRTLPKYTGKEVGRKNIDSLKKQILKDGLKEPLVVEYNPESGFASIIEGNHRIQAMKELGFKKVPVSIIPNNKFVQDLKSGKSGKYLGKGNILPNQFGEYNAEYLPSQIIPELSKGKKFRVGFDPIDKKTKLIPTEGTYEKIPLPNKIETKEITKKSSNKDILVKTTSLPKAEFRKKISGKNSFENFKAVKESIYKQFDKKNQEIDGSVLRYPLSTKDIRNPDLSTGTYGQARFEIPKKEDFNQFDFLTKNEIIKLSDIIKKAKSAFNIKYSTKNVKKQVMKGAYGYYAKTGQIKGRAYDDVQTFFHELAHYLSIGKYDLNQSLKKYTTEFRKELDKEADKYIKNAGWETDYLQGTRIHFEEAFAEFLRRHLFYPNSEKIDSPAFYKFLEDNLTNKDKNIILNLQEDIKKFTDQNLYERALSQISFGEKPKREFPKFNDLIEKTKLFLEKFYTRFVEEQRPIEKALEPYGVRGEKVFREFRLIKGVGGKARQWIENGVTDENGKIVFDSLTKILEPVKNKQKEFTLYLILKRSEDLIKRGFDVGNKLTNAEVKILIDRIETEFPEFINPQKNLVKFQHFLLAELVKAGKISSIEANNMIKLNPNYVPFYRDFDLDELTPQQAKFYGVVSGIFKLKGSTREIIDPIESIIKNVYSFLYTAEKNKLLNNFVNTLFSTADSTVLSKTANLLEKIEVPLTPTKIKLKEIRQKISNQIDDESYQILQDEKNIKKRLLQNLTDGKITQEIYEQAIKKIEEETNIKLSAIASFSRDFDYSQMTEIFRPNPSIVKNRGNVIALTKNVNGKIKTEYYQLSPDLYNAIVTSDTRDLGFIMNALNIPTRIFRTGITSTFEFLFKNLFRDQFSYAINSKAGYIPYVDMIRGMFHVFGKSDVYQKFLTSGAEQSFRSSMDRNYLKEDLRKIIKDESKKPGMNIITKAEQVIGLVEKMSQFIETSSKIGNLAKGLKKFEGAGKTDSEILKEAAIDSRDLIDFSRRGSWGKNINAVSAFFNSAVQGLDKTVRVFKDPKTRNQALAKSVTYITLPTIFLYFANRDNPKYQELQDWDKDLFWHFWVGDTHFRLPIPFELGVVFKVIPERILSTLDQNDKPWSGFGKTAMDTFNFIPSNPSNGFGITLLSPIIQAIGNTNYFGSKIVPMREQFLPPEEKFGYNTSESAKLIGKIISKIPGYRDVKMLEILATPRHVDNIVQGYFGTLGKYALDALDILINPSNSLKKPSPEIGSLPGFKAFLAPQITNTKSFDEFYNELSRLREEYNTSLKNDTKFLEYQKRNVFEKAAKILQEYSKIERKIQKDDTLTPKQKTEKLLKLHQLELNYIRQFLGKKEITQYIPNKNN